MEPYRLESHSRKARLQLSQKQRAGMASFVRCAAMRSGSFQTSHARSAGASLKCSKAARAKRWRFSVTTRWE